MLRLAVAASGGADSTALQLEAAHRFHPQQVVVLSVDHRTRASAEVERAHACHVAAQLGFGFQELRIEATQPNQAAWREARMAALITFCQDHGIARLWLGHHRDDAAETAVLRLLAGGNLASLAGISAMRQVGQVGIERPLLNRSARELRRNLMAAGLGWYEDPSNRNAKYRRVAVRRLLAAGKVLEPAVLVRRTGHWRAARQQTLANAWRLAANAGEATGLTLSPEIVRALPPDLATEVLHQASLMVAGREQRLRQVDFGGVLALGDPPWPLGGARVWLHKGRWLVGRDYRHIQARTALKSGVAATWDARYRVKLASGVGQGDWLAARVGLTAARRLHLDLPAEWAAAEMGIWQGDRLIAIPQLGIWTGHDGAVLQKNLHWQRLSGVVTESFRVAP